MPRLVFLASLQSGRVYLVRAISSCDEDKFMNAAGVVRQSCLSASVSYYAPVPIGGYIKH